MPSDAIRGTSSAYFYEKEKGSISVAGGILVGKETNWRQDEDLFPGVRRIGGLFLPRSTTPVYGSTSFCRLHRGYLLLMK